jgi:hypothetical protein
MKTTATIDRKSIKILALWLRSMSPEMENWTDGQELRIDLDVDDDGRVTDWHPFLSAVCPILKPAGLEEKKNGQGSASEKA